MKNNGSKWSNTLNYSTFLHQNNRSNLKKYEDLFWVHCLSLALYIWQKIDHKKYEDTFTEIPNSNSLDSVYK